MVATAIIGRDNERSEPLDVDMTFEVRIPPGVELGVRTVDGSVDARGIDTPAQHSHGRWRYYLRRRRARRTEHGGRQDLGDHHATYAGTTT